MISNQTGIQLKLMRKLLRFHLIPQISMSNNYKRFIALTLAEVLISLLIIGIVASLVIPSVMQDIQDAELKTAWKKSYSILDQATKRIMMDKGMSFKDICGDWDSDCFKNLYLPYLNYSKACAEGQLWRNCWHNGLNNFWFLDGTPADSRWSNVAGAVLNDGTLIYFEYTWRKCTNVTRGISRCGEIAVDVNGFKRPNRIGKDIFTIHVIEKGIKPWGTYEDNLSKDCEGSTGVDSGYGCSAKYLYN